MGVSLLSDLIVFFDEAAKALPADKVHLTTAQILKHLNDLDDRPWPTFSRGRELTARKLGALLKPFGIRSININLGKENGGKLKVLKGYDAAHFADSFDRYPLEHRDPRDLSAIPLYRQKTADDSTILSSTGERGVADKTGPKPPENMKSSGIADVSGMAREEDIERNSIQIFDGRKFGAE